MIETGKKDKNGNVIKSGDTIMFGYKHDNPTFYNYNGKYVVSYGKGTYDMGEYEYLGWVLTNEKGEFDGFGWILNEDSNELEVIT